MAEIRVSGSVIYQNIQFAVFLFTVFETCVDLIHFANMAGQFFSAAAGCCNFIRYALTAINFTAGNDDVRTAGGQQLGNAFTDTTAGAGDQCYTAGQIKQFLWVHNDLPGYYYRSAVRQKMLPGLRQMLMFIKGCQADFTAAVIQQLGNAAVQQGPVHIKGFAVT